MSGVQKIILSCRSLVNLYFSFVLFRIVVHKDLQEITKDVKSVVTGIEWLVLEKSILTNVKKKRTSIINAHEKKLKNLSRNFTLPFTSDEVITNLSNYQLSDTERDLFKYGYCTR